MDMKQFVHQRDRAASPNGHKNGQRINPERRAIAANAKVALRKAPASVTQVAQEAHQSQAPPGLPSRGFGNAQNTSATVQHDSRRRHEAHGHRPDAFDTDAESLDTTVNQSVINAESDQVKDAAEQRHDLVVGLRSDGLAKEDDEYDESDGIEYEEVDVGEYILRTEDLNFLRQHGQQQLTQEQAIEFLVQHRPESFRTVEGDSYPSTTDGHPTEWNGKAEPSSELLDDDEGPASPSLLARGLNLRPPLTPLSMRRGLADGDAERPGRHANKLFQQSAHLRDQQRGSRHSGGPMQSSQPPSYSQANQVFVPSPTLNLFTHSVQPHGQNLQQPQSQKQWIAQPFNAGQSATPTHRLSSAHNKVVPAIQHQVMDPVQPQSSNIAPEGDYDFEDLNAIQFDELKREDFDHNPRALPQLLSDDMQRKPLTERLEHVQHNFDAGKQSQFFSALPTAEWEDAGDWFLEQFSSIIRRTKDARQNKRKLAQGFEDEIEKRHDHVSKKQRQVEEAMHKMQTQGEGLMPRSPRASKSPKPKKR
ncbi:extracellular mutant protein 11-domain-containing protein [Phaeosphaeria sp. MPI-PUGE-AT-0046c]|nr:extracellular mutant protein 11-domain-containing protein [Phaeosphaeria sp. MPI-PUGE-AT-0046c]